MEENTFMNHNQQKTFLSISEAAELTNVTRQAIYVAIKLNKLKARKESARWTIHVNDLDDYRQNRYSRARSRFQGELLFDNENGYYSVSQTATILGEPIQRIYYSMRSGKLKAIRKGTAWVVLKESIDEYIQLSRSRASEGRLDGESETSALIEEKRLEGIA